MLVLRLKAVVSDICIPEYIFTECAVEQCESDALMERQGRSLHPHIDIFDPSGDAYVDV